MNSTPDFISEINPWPGLASYSGNDAKYFFGRTREIAELTDRLLTEPLLCLYGPSGTGKTSLLQAGIGSRIREHSFFPVFIRLDHLSPSMDYIAQTIMAVTKTAAIESLETEEIEPALPDDQPETLWSFFHRNIFWDQRNNLVKPLLIFDQFEEIFTLSTSIIKSREFIRNLGDLAENAVPDSIQNFLKESGIKFRIPANTQNYRIVLSLREDFLARYEQLTAGFPVFRRNRFAVQALNGEQALEVINLPGGKILDTGVSSSIIDSISIHQSKNGEKIPIQDRIIEPALLSLFCRELNERRLKEKLDRVSVNMVKDQGGDIIRSFYQNSMNIVSNTTRAILEDQLLTESGFRNQVALEDLIASGITNSGITELIMVRVLRMDEWQQVLRVEFSHDILAREAMISRNNRRAEQAIEQAQKRTQELESESKLSKNIFLVCDLFLTGLMLLLAIRCYENRYADFTFSISGLARSLPYAVFILYGFLLRSVLSLLMFSNEKKGLPVAILFLLIWYFRPLSGLFYATPEYLSYAWQENLPHYLKYVYDNKMADQLIAYCIIFWIFFYPVLFYLRRLLSWSKNSNTATWGTIFSLSYYRTTSLKRPLEAVSLVYFAVVAAMIVGLSAHHVSCAFTGILLSLISAFGFLRLCSKGTPVFKGKSRKFLLGIIVVALLFAIWYSQFLTSGRLLIYWTVFPALVLLTLYTINRLSARSIQYKLLLATGLISVSFGLIPLLSFGFNIFSMTDYALVNIFLNPHGFNEGEFLSANKHGQLGVRSRYSMMVPVKFDHIARAGHQFLVSKEGKWGLYEPQQFYSNNQWFRPFASYSEPDNGLVIPCRFQSIRSADGWGVNFVVSCDTGKKGVFNTRLGALVIPCSYDEIYNLTVSDDLRSIQGKAINNGTIEVINHLTGTE